MGKSLADLTAEIREINVAHGWRLAEGGPGENTFGDYLALLHSEVSEALEAYRDHRLADATAEPNRAEMGTCSFPATCDNLLCAVHAVAKPEGVGSELADVLIRLLDMCDVFDLTPFDMDCELADVASIPLRGESFGDHLAWLHHCAAVLWVEPDVNYAGFLRALVSVARFYRIDLTAEVERKIAFNRTRSFQHGGRTLAGER